MNSPALTDLLAEYERALEYTDDLQDGLTDDQLSWRPSDDSSAIAWHLGHQPAVAHYMLRNLTAAEQRIDADLEALMDSATPEPERGGLPSIDRIRDYRGAVAERVRFRIGRIEAGEVGAPSQMRVVGAGLLAALIDHEYQHDRWIGEVRVDAHGLDLPRDPMSALLTEIDGYLVVNR